MHKFRLVVTKWADLPPNLRGDVTFNLRGMVVIEADRWSITEHGALLFTVGKFNKWAFNKDVWLSVELVDE